jgi:hypothetical protein
MLVIDTLHALLLGPAQRYCLKALWAVVEANVYGMDFPHQDTRDGSCIGLLRTELFDWYATQRTQFHNDVTQLDDLTPDMLGKRSERTLTIKGMECRWLIPFCVELVDRYRVHLPNDTYMALSASGHALVDLLERIDSGAVNPTHAEAKVIADGMHICFCYYLFPGIISGMRFPIILVLGQGVYLMCRFVGVSLLCIEVALLEARREAAIHSELCCFKTAAYELYWGLFGVILHLWWNLVEQVMFDLYATYMRESKTIIDPQPKTHLLLHLFDRVPETGNPRNFAFFKDEDLNRPLAAISKTAYALTFHQRVLSYFRKAHGSTRKRQFWSCTCIMDEQASGYDH